MAQAEASAATRNEFVVEGRILLVEDDEVVRDMVANLLTMAGMSNITQAGTGEAARNEFFNAPGEFVAALVDWQLPGMSGLELVQEIREGGFQLPIVMVTSQSRRSDVQAAVRAGVTDYVVKPFNHELIDQKLSRLRRLLELRSLGGTQQVRHAMTTNVVSAKPHHTVREAAETLISTGISGMPVIGHERQVLGVLTEGGLVKVLFMPDMLDRTVEEVMTTDVVVANEDTLLSDVAVSMVNNHVRRLPVVRDGELVGIIARRDLTRFALANEATLQRFATLLHAEMTGRIGAESPESIGSLA